MTETFEQMVRRIAPTTRADLLSDQVLFAFARRIVEAVVPREKPRFQDDSDSTRAYVLKLLTAIELYEAALKASWPEGAEGEAFELWNKARIALEETT